MNRNGIVVERLYRGDHLLMDLPGDKHKEREALLLVVVLNHKVIEICPILQVLVKRFNPPAFFISAKYLLCRFGAVALQDVHTESFLVLLKLLPGISGAPEFHAVLVVITALFVFIDVAEDINVSAVRYPSGHIFNPCMLFAGSVIEAAGVPDIFHGIPEDIRVRRHRYDICIVIGRKDLQVFRAVKATVDNEQNPCEL